MYLTTSADVLACLTSAFQNLRPGGALLVVPDVVSETFWERAVHGGNEEDHRAIQVMEWHWDPDPDDNQFFVEFVVMMRDGQTMETLIERHTMGLFSYRLCSST